MSDKKTDVNKDIKDYDTSKLKKTNTKEKVYKPTSKDIEDEKKEQTATK